MWWEEEFIAAFHSMGSGLLNGNAEDDEMVGGCGGIVKGSDPEKFVGMVVKSSDLLMGI